MPVKVALRRATARPTPALLSKLDALGRGARRGDLDAATAPTACTSTSDGKAETVFLRSLAKGSRSQARCRPRSTTRSRGCRSPR